MESKGTVFDGFLSGKVYDRLASLFGFGPALYRRAADLAPVAPGQVILDIGCGTGAFCSAVANRIGAECEIHGVDLSQKQLDEAREKMESKGVGFVPHPCSMDELPFPPATFDTVITSLAIHSATPPVRRAAITETARVLKDGGNFVLVDWTRPRGFFGRVLWFPFSPALRGDDSRDNWDNRYVSLCEGENLRLKDSEFVSSFVLYQCFEKE